jgi:hypothetical protein
VVFSDWDSLALSALESLRACFVSVKDVTVADQAVFSSNSSCCAVASCAARAIVNIVKN